MFNYHRDFELLWNTTTDTSLNLVNLPAGSYSFQYIDEFNCTFKDTIHIVNPNLMNIQAQFTLEDSLLNLYSFDYIVNGGAQPYTVYLNESPIDSFDLTSLEEKEYVLEVYDNQQCYIFETFNLYWQEPLNISLFEDKYQFSIFPNPTSNYVTIAFQEDFQKINIYDLYGRKVMVSNSLEIDMTNFSKGVYMIELLCMHEKFIKKIIKQ